MATARPALARRYAEALYDQLEGPGEIERALRALSVLGELWQKTPQVRKLLLAPSISVEERVQMAGRLAGGEVPGAVLDLLRLILERRRQSLLPLLHEALRQTRDEHQGVLRVVVTTAHPLDEEQRAEARQLAERLAGRKVELEEQVDPGLLGGLRLRVGDRLLDASLRAQLHRLIEELVSLPIGAGPPAEESD
ncbi:MAG: ATP synthase F1 subunit delta [Armatimonadetes bacterium]|nr:ATP synthase F1 subunit delta [Armatimonadota bacterium]